ncbi:MAG: hypothetical protein H2184_17130 [Candidatus Galacturonibacter soehngenii]|nr:hypothetical protein [Candidatus Galacturonibacter soehngenii]
MMKKKKIVTLVAIALSAIVIWAYNEYKPLPVVYCTSTYPDYSVKELAIESENIVYGKVVSIAPTQMHEVRVSTTLDPTKVEDVLYYPVTPVTISIKDSIKGDELSKIIYFEESGVTDTYIQKAQGYQMSQGMEVVLFLNEEGYGWGSQSVYPVIDDQVVLQDKAINEIPSNKINSISADVIEEKYSISSSYEAENVSTTSLDEFLKLVNSYIN